MFMLYCIGNIDKLLNSKQPKATMVSKKERKKTIKKYNNSFSDYMNNLFGALEDSLENIW